MIPRHSNRSQYNLMRTASAGPEADAPPAPPSMLKTLQAAALRLWSTTNARRRLVFLIVVFTGFCAITFEIAALGLYAKYITGDDTLPYSPAYVGISLADLVITVISVIVLGRVEMLWVRKLHKLQRAGEEAGKSKEEVDNITVPPPGTFVRAIYVALLILNLFSMVSTIVVFVGASSNFLNYRPDDLVNFGVGLEVVGSLSVSFIVFFTVSITIYMWWPIFMLSQCIMLIGSILQFLVTTICILINMGRLTDFVHGYFISDDGEREQKIIQEIHFVQFYPHLSMLLSCAGFMGAGLLMGVTTRNRLSEVMITMVQYYMMLLRAGFVLCIVWLILALVQAARAAERATGFLDIYIANPILAFAGMVINTICLYAAKAFIRRPMSRLKVEAYDLCKLGPSQLKSWADLIDQYSKQLIPGAPSGKEALDLMQAYVASPMTNFRCVVLRVYDETVRDREHAKHYEQVRAWANLDSAVVFKDDRQEKAAESADTSSTLIDGGGKDKELSKNALKRLQHKQQKKAQKGKGKGKENISFPVHADPEVSPEKVQEDLAFRATLIATEALVLFTYIDDYDLTSPIQGKFGELLRKTMGPNSWFKVLTLKFGLLATHWPFRQTTFYTSPSKKPNARAVAILQALANWNDNLPRSERCSLILDPVYAHNGAESMFKPGGWLTTHVPPSHVVDLRMYMGKSMPEYLKAIKYRNQASAFKAANGVVDETTDFSRENCEVVIDLWHKIADKRTADGHTAVLKEPTVDFIMSLGSAENNPNKYRRLLFLRVDGKVIASCVLFILGDTITSDIQGLDHESARTYKAYFVMMQETIAIALREKIQFVDFGPTTSKPKMDIGAAEVPLVGGLYAREPLSTMVNLFANQVNSG